MTGGGVEAGLGASVGGRRYIARAAVGAAGVVGCLLLAGPFARAQNVSQPETQVPSQIEQQLGGVARGQEATQAIGALNEFENLTVSYQDLLKNPDDIGTNYRFALQRIREGRLETAAAALQRILLIAPDQLAVRLLYAVVLYRLDDPIEAEIELKRVAAANPPADIQQVVDDYLGRIHARLRTFRGEATISVGTTYDDNRNAFPRTGQAFALGNLGPVASVRTNDTGLNEIASASLSYDPGGQRLNEMFANVALFGVQQSRVHSLDTNAAIGEVGATYRASWADVKPSIFAEAINIGHQPYLRIGGGKLTLSRYLTAQLQAVAVAKIDYEYYVNTEVLPANNDQNGTVYDGSFGLNWFASPSFALKGTFESALKHADALPDRYISSLVKLEATYVLPWRSFLLASASQEWRTYRGPDPFVSSTLRRIDSIGQAGITYGLPLDTIIAPDEPADFLRGFVISIFANVEDNKSNVPNFDWSTWRAGALVSRRWSF